MAALWTARMGERMRSRRTELDMSRSDLAERITGKTDANAIYRWETGRHRPSDDTLEQIAQALDVPVSYFLVEDGDKTAGTPDLAAALNGDAGQLDRIEQALADISERLGALGALTARIALALNLPDERATPDDGDGDDEVEAVTADLQAATKGASPSAKQPRQAATAARGHARKARGK